MGATPSPDARDAGAVAGLLLAAGAARRFGGGEAGDAQKLLAPVHSLGGVARGRAAAAALAAAGVAPLLAVTGRAGDAVARVLAGLPVETVHNPDWARGMSTSLRAGIAALVARHPAVAAVVIALGDQPTLRPEAARAVVARFRDTGAPVVVPRYAGERGHPVLFARALFAELLAVEGDRGGREVVERDSARVVYVDLSYAAPGDVDTRADLRHLDEPGSA